MESQTDVILNWIKDRVEQKKADFDVNFWLEVAMKLTILLPDEIGKLYDYQKEVAQMRLDILGGQEKRNVSEVKMRVEASDVYRDMKKQEAKIGQVEEIVRIAKIQARVNSGN
jgi:hypothetical protein